jgi:hypothetical protein
MSNNHSKSLLVASLLTLMQLETSSAYATTQGPTGPAGPKGATGSQGVAGPHGVQGTQGAAGTRGALGAQGVAGTHGTQGVQGVAGTHGTQGAQGIAGPRGTQGAAGGAQGATGAQGVAGPAGAKGANGTNQLAVSIGEQYQGGIVFYVDATGQHGLIAALADQNAGAPIQWTNETSFVINVTANGLYAGIKNTAAIIAAQASVAASQAFTCATINAPIAGQCPAPTMGNYAAQLAAAYSANPNGTPCSLTNFPDSLFDPTQMCYGDWYLPAEFELSLLYQQKSVVGGFNNTGYYWSSSEQVNGNTSNAWMIQFPNGYPEYVDKTSLLYVRPIRAF